MLFPNYDKTERVLRTAMIVIAIIGFGVASYLTVVHYVGLKALACTNSGCATVQTSKYSEVAGVSVAVLGLIGYFFILISLFVRVSELSRLVTLSLTLGGFAFSAYLTGRELFTIHAICEWCVSSAVLLTILFILSVVRYLRGDAPAPTAPSEAAAKSDERAGQRASVATP